MIVDGRSLAEEVLALVKSRAETLPRRPQVAAYAPNPTPATLSYLNIKQRFSEKAGCDFKVVNELDFGEADAAIIQLPLPEGVSNDILDSIPIEKDADVLSRAARENFEHGEAGSLLPPVVGAIKKIFEYGKVEVKGKQTVVVGSGFLVGAPASVWLKQQGALVEVIHSPDSFAEAKAALAEADIIVSGAGSPHLIKPEMIKEGVVLIDAGTSESSGKIVGDADPACADKCALFTPVPGGVGPLAVACLFENVATLLEKAMNL